MSKDEKKEAVFTSTTTILIRSLAMSFAATDNQLSLYGKVFNQEKKCFQHTFASKDTLYDVAKLYVGMAPKTQLRFDMVRFSQKDKSTLVLGFDVPLSMQVDQAFGNVALVELYAHSILDPYPMYLRLNTAMNAYESKLQWPLWKANEQDVINLGRLGSWEEPKATMEENQSWPPRFHGQQEKDPAINNECRHLIVVSLNSGKVLKVVNRAAYVDACQAMDGKELFTHTQLNNQQLSQMGRLATMPKRALHMISWPSGEMSNAYAKILS